MDSPKILAFYLPQFHTFPENDMWWGKGFTEWVNVKKARPLYKKHNQPRIPEKNNYYDLTNPKVLESQMSLAEKYGIYGFCYYHYWFDGKLLLEKPLEMMLKMEKKIHYCFCWANEPWTRSWEGDTKKILMPQKYGGEKEWEEHFNYLLPFFEDEFYIKVDGKPVLVLYRTNNIPNADKMIAYWNSRCIESGFNGIFVVEERNSFQKEEVCNNSAAVLEFEPMFTLKYGRNKIQRVLDKTLTFIHNSINGNNLLLYRYENIWKAILHRKQMNREKKIFLGGFVDWDNTPRKGKNGLIIQGANPEKFSKFFSLQLEKAKKMESEFIFVNAWNEWGEGTYLEPDTVFGLKYLQVIKDLTESIK